MMKDKSWDMATLLRIGLLGPHPVHSRATCGWVLAQKKNMGLTLIWRVCKGFVLCEWESVWGRSAVNPTNLALVT